MQKVLHRSIDVVPCFSRKIEVEKKSGKINGKVKLGYYGRLIPEKGIDVLSGLVVIQIVRILKFMFGGKAIITRLITLINFQR